MMPALISGLTPLARAFIPEGSMSMGSPQFVNALPVIPVTVSAFSISETKVTWGEYREYLQALDGHRFTLAVTDPLTGQTFIMGRERSAPDMIRTYADSMREAKTPHGARLIHGGFTVFEVKEPDVSGGFRETPDQPVVGINWWEMLAFAAAHGGSLPTEAEYERVMRGILGKDDFGTVSGALRKANGLKLAQFGEDRTVPVRSHQPNAWGVFDASGNAWVWTETRYANNYTRLEKYRDPQGPKSGTLRVLRGGCAGSDERLLHAACRIEFDPELRDTGIGGVVAWRSRRAS